MWEELERLAENFHDTEDSSIHQYHTNELAKFMEKTKIVPGTWILIKEREYVWNRDFGDNNYSIRHRIAVDSW